jgi:hypothetical protein
MRGLCKFGLTLGLAAFIIGPALAQRGQGMGGGGILGMLMNKSVQDELKLDKDQLDKGKEAIQKFREDNKDDLEKLRDMNLPREDRVELSRKIGKASEKLAAEILKPDQVKRLNQIRMQQEGVGALVNPETVKALKLSDKQKDDLKTIGEDLQKEMREAFQSAGDDRQELMKKMTALRKDKMDAALKVLTDDQKKAFKELVGAPFEMKREPRP